MTSDRESHGLRQFLKLAAAIPLLFVGMLMVKAIAIAEEIYPLRRWLVKKDALGYNPPDESAIFDCPGCAYEGIANVDKHRPAPMSDVNWGLYCPECDYEFEAPLFREDVADYVSRARGNEATGALVKIGDYGAYKAVMAHNSRYALPKSRIEELTEVDNRA